MYLRIASILSNTQYHDLVIGCKFRILIMYPNTGQKRTNKVKYGDGHHHGR